MNQQPIAKKSIFRRWWFWTIIIIIIAFIAFSAFSKNRDRSSSPQQNREAKVRDDFEWPDPSAKTITAVPFDLSQIDLISKFRSCAGHDRSGYNFDRVLETDRSMKDYFYPTSEYAGTKDKIKLLAPFDGQIAWIMTESDEGIAEESALRKNGEISTQGPQKSETTRKQSGAGVGLVSKLDENAIFAFGHVILTPASLKVGDNVKAGELIGYASLGDVGSDFDVDYRAREKKPEGGQNDKEVFDSMFNHMTPQVLGEFANVGLTPENTIFSKEERDAKPCGYDPVTKYSPKVCSNGRDNECWVKLNH